MSTYIILSKISPEAFADSRGFKALASEVSEKIKQECPGVEWKDSYATMGRFDVVDIVEADTPQQAEKAAVIIRSAGNSMTETLLATPWDEFLDTL